MRSKSAYDASGSVPRFGSGHRSTNVSNVRRSVSRAEPIVCCAACRSAAEHVAGAGEHGVERRRGRPPVRRPAVAVRPVAPRRPLEVGALLGADGVPAAARRRAPAGRRRPSSVVDDQARAELPGLVLGRVRAPRVRPLDRASRARATRSCSRVTSGLPDVTSSMTCSHRARSASTAATSTWSQVTSTSASYARRSASCRSSAASASTTRCLGEREPLLGARDLLVEVRQAARVGEARARWRGPARRGHPACPPTPGPNGVSAFACCESSPGVSTQTYANRAGQLAAEPAGERARRGSPAGPAASAASSATSSRRPVGTPSNRMRRAVGTASIALRNARRCATSMSISVANPPSARLNASRHGSCSVRTSTSSATNGRSSGVRPAACGQRRPRACRSPGMLSRRRATAARSAAQLRQVGGGLLASRTSRRTAPAGRSPWRRCPPAPRAPGATRAASSASRRRPTRRAARRSTSSSRARARARRRPAAPRRPRSSRCARRQPVAARRPQRLLDPVQLRLARPRSGPAVSAASRCASRCRRCRSSSTRPQQVRAGARGATARPARCRRRTCRSASMTRSRSAAVVDRRRGARGSARGP